MPGQLADDAARGQGAPCPGAGASSPWHSFSRTEVEEGRRASGSTQYVWRASYCAGWKKNIPFSIYERISNAILSLEVPS
ncbi:Protein of unknown function [Gryllus bimaculatus]|nr:Protein of unknown function [Gryllus bimaculatus]